MAAPDRITTTTRLSRATLKRLDDRAMRGETRSDRLEHDLRTMHAALDHGLARAMRILSRDEALLVLEVQNGALVGPESLSLWLSGGLAHQVDDALTLDGANDSVDQAAFLAKLDALGEIGVLALLDWAAQAWGHGLDLAAEASKFTG